MDRRYRPDIDGLRALAVVPVIFFHLGGWPARGGFVGVDVFFVISGYLISSIVFDEIERQRFSFVHFYERRARRLAPALLTVVFATTILAVIYLFPQESIDYTHSVIATLLFFSNIYFWSLQGYFTDLSGAYPLLHTWSLGIEEQFYLVFPFVFVLLHRYAKGRTNAYLAITLVVSFVMCAVGVRLNWSAAFYLPQNRAWEFLIGTLLARGAFPPIRGAITRNLVGAVGLAAIAVPEYTYTTHTPFPGFAALVPCLGTALVIGSAMTDETIVSKLLSLRPMVFTGLISYSLYLWHWPIIVFMRLEYFVKGEHTPGAKLTAIGLSFLLAALTWKYIEMPFRRGPRRPEGRWLFGLVAGGAVANLAVVFGLFFANGAAWRYPAKAVQAEAYIDYQPGPDYREGVCFLGDPASRLSQFDKSLCLHERDDQKNYLLIGDSHAAQLWYGLKETLPDVNIMQATASGCKPLIEQKPDSAAYCTELMQYIFNDFLLHHHVDKLLIAAQWVDADLDPELARLNRTLEWTTQHDVSVILLGPIVQYDGMLPRLLAESISSGDPTYVAGHRADLAMFDSAVEKVALNWHVTYISQQRALCDKEVCAAVTDTGVPLQFDGQHLTGPGSVFVAKTLLQKGYLK